MAGQAPFLYPLEPYRRRCEWDLNEALCDLAAATQALAEQETRCDAAQRELAAAQGAGTQRPGSLLRPDLHRLTQDYLAHLHRQLRRQQEEAARLAAQREEALGRSHHLRKLTDGVEEHRRGALREHEKQLAALACKDADDIWLQRIGWRTRR
ncbi:hypothetical protein [Massilia endophytica]|uniref:hypothetical protein n=1 Tax=Massilia endophytica TaxID=2899220 RepID=UPI001E3F6711|nr:hypothetical protein [Massilia endophytica]UGQ47971.1 hypothetical protein LSQ66_05760 [Massilia endophytica]